MRTESGATIGHVKRSAQKALSVGRARLVSSSGRALDGASTVKLQSVT